MSNGPNPTKIVEGESIIMDEAILTDTKFYRCRMVYKGGGLPLMQNCLFLECNFVFEGPALNTVQLMRGMAASGGADLVLQGMLGIESGNIVH